MFVGGFTTILHQSELSIPQYDVHLMARLDDEKVATTLRFLPTLLKQRLLKKVICAK